MHQRNWCLYIGTITAASIVAIGGDNVGKQIGAQEGAKVIAAIRAGNQWKNLLHGQF